MRAAVAVFALALWLQACGGDGGASEADRDRAVDTATGVFDDAKASGQDLDEGPCIAEELPGLPDWVVDIAHEPRADVDDDPANQCQRYRDGDASHFVELTPQGELIRAE